MILCYSPHKFKTSPPRYFPIDYLLRLDMAGVAGVVVGVLVRSDGIGIHMWTANKVTSCETQ